MPISWKQVAACSSYFAAERNVWGHLSFSRHRRAISARVHAKATTTTFLENGRISLELFLILLMWEWTFLRVLEPIHLSKMSNCGKIWPSQQLQLSMPIFPRHSHVATWTFNFPCAAHCRQASAARQPRFANAVADTVWDSRPPAKSSWWCRQWCSPNSKLAKYTPWTSINHPTVLQCNNVLHVHRHTHTHYKP